MFTRVKNKISSKKNRKEAYSMTLNKTLNLLY